MPDLTELAQKIALAAATALGSGVVGWLAAAARFSGRLSAMEAQVVRDLKQIDADLRRLEKDLRGELAALEGKFQAVNKQVDDVEDSSHDLAKHADLARFMVEVNQRWNDIVRIVARIEGFLDAKAGKRPTKT